MLLAVSLNPMVFLALFAIAVGAFTGLLLMFVGLVEAPWQILLVLLIAGLYSLQRISAETENLPTVLSNIRETNIQETDIRKKPEQPIAKETIQKDTIQPEKGLQYRGARYPEHHDDAASATDSPQVVEGTYRGHHWQRSQSAPSNSSPPMEVTYRGHKVAKAQPPEAESKSESGTK